MRRAFGFAIIVAAAGAAVVIAPGIGCSHDAKPAVEPDPNPPLPPASGTPIGYLVDDAGELKLTDAQLGKLKAIDDDLAAKLAALDGALRGPSPAQSGQSTGRRRGGGGGGGMRGGGMRGGGMRGGGARGGGAGNSNGSGSGGAGSGAPRRGASADTIGRVTEERAADVRDAIDRALAELDMIQRIAAKRVLADHGVDVDAGRAGAAPGAAKPGRPGAEPAGEPDEPDEPAGDGSGSN